MYFIRSGGEYVPTTIQAGDVAIIATHGGYRFWVHRCGTGPLWMRKGQEYVRVFTLAHIQGNSPMMSVTRQYGIQATGGATMSWEEVRDRLGFRNILGRRKFRASLLKL